MTGQVDPGWAAQRCAETIRRARNRTCPACEPIVHDPTGCTLCGGTREVSEVVRTLFDVDDVAALVALVSGGVLP